MSLGQIGCGLAVVLLMSVPTLALDVDNPPGGVFSDEWYVIRIQEKKSGHAHNTMERIKRKGGDVVRAKTDISLSMGRANQTVNLQVVQQSEETLEGKPLAFENRMKMGILGEQVTSGKVAGGKVTISTTQFGQQSDTKLYDLPAGAMMSWAIYREQLKRGLEPGNKYELSLYEPTMAPDRLTPVTVEILGRETLDLYGRKVEAVKTKQTMRINGMLGGATDMETVTWIKPDGETIRMDMSMMGMAIEMVACAKSVALAPNDPAEMMLETLIRPEGPINRNAEGLRYRLAFKERTGKAELSDIPETDIQKIGRRGKDEARLTVRRRPASLKGTGPNKLTPAERQRYLAASSVANYKDPVVARLVKEAAGGEKDHWKLAEKLCRFARRHITKKNLGVGFATASEVARSKEGDCTEHGILLAALGRGCGIPTRVVTGVVYADQFEGKAGVFVGHMWTQFWIDGWWVDLDAARGETVVDPTHIAFSLSEAGDNSIADMVSSVWLNLGKLRITVLSGE